MFKFILFFIIVGAMGHHGIPPLVAAATLSLLVLVLMDDLERKVRRIEEEPKNGGRLEELEDIKRDIGELRRDLEQNGKAATRLDWHLGQRPDDTEFRQVLDGLASALARLDSLEVEMRLRTPPARA